MTHHTLERQTLDRPSPVTTNQRLRDLTVFFAATFGLTWGLAAIALFAPEVILLVTGSPLSATNPLFFLATYSPSVVGIIMIAARSGFAGLGELATRLFHWRVHPGYYALIFGGMLAADVLARVLQSAVAGETTTSGGLPLWSLLLNGIPPTPLEFWFAAPLFLLATLVLNPGPLEEIGWKGYALPRIIDRPRGPLLGAVLFGLIWGLWHAPAFAISGTAQHDLGISFVWLMLGTVNLSVIMTWLYRRTSGSILVSGILVHLMANSRVSDIWAYDLVLLVPAALAGISLYRAGKTISS